MIYTVKIEILIDEIPNDCTGLDFGGDFGKDYADYGWPEVACAG